LAVHLLRGGVTLETIGKMLGHRSPESTTVYLGLSIEDLREVGLPVPTGGEPVVLPPKSRKNKQPCVGHQVTKPLAKAHFHSPLASSLRRYLAIRRALGRSYIDVEATLRYWDDFLQHRFPKARLIRSEMLQGWDQTMSQVSPTTRRQRLQIVRNFLLFHARQHPETHIPDLTTFPKPVPQRPPRLVSAEEMANVLATVSNWPASPANPLRSETIRLAFILLFCCGLRRGELVRLQWRHIDIQKGILHIEASKFHKSRLVPMSKSVTKELGEYWALRCRREKAVQPENYLIWSNHHLANKQVYCAHSIGNNWRQLCRAMEITDGRGRPPRLHDIRHSCAVGILERWYRLGYDINAKLPYLATYLGHVNPVSTHHYLHFTPELQQAASRRFHDYAFRIFARGGAR
jgi:integrase